MKRSPKTACSQFSLALHREPSLQLDQPGTEELLNVLAELMREALGGPAMENEGEKEESNESKDHA